MKAFIGRSAQEKKVSNKKWIISGMVTFLWGMEGVYQEDSLTSADRAIPDWLIKGYIPGRGRNCS